MPKGYNIVFFILIWLVNFPFLTHYSLFIVVSGNYGKEKKFTKKIKNLEWNSGCKLVLYSGRF